ncbi:MAG: MoxR family ATPase [Alkalinema sp. RL_2_19]|nr:MoxR family ATPase [Alkalinema sp. RL_2_19]
MSTSIDYHYSGARDEAGQEIPRLQPPKGFVDPSDRKYDPYLPSDDLIEAVNLAIELEVPLLLEGEPGCGKTRLAGAIAYEFTQKYLKQKQQAEPDWWPYYVWNVKSIGRARDGLYDFDAVLRLRDAQMAGTGADWMQDASWEKERKAIKERLTDKTKYVKEGPLGKAFLEEEYRPIVLIDEIDKADTDFPNDLLFELDRFGFEVPEAGIPFRAAKHKPIILITSNRERPLPEAFLRRCVYFWMDFPEPDDLQRIITQRFGDRLEGKASLLEQAIAQFIGMRDGLKDQPGSKPPGTSEILQFMDVLLKRSASSEAKGQEILKNLHNQSPFLGILLKTQQDQQHYRKAMQEQAEASAANG